MSYTPEDWKDLPSKETPIDAKNLNKMEQGIVKRAVHDRQVVQPT